MITPNPLIGTGLHALGGISASSCYLPSNKTQKWSWGTFWLVQASFAWILMPILFGMLTVPDFFSILGRAPLHAVVWAFFFGAVYGFGGLSFGLAIKHIGYSLTYTISIGISAVLGTLIPLMIFGGIDTYFFRPGGGIVLTGMIVSIAGVTLCGLAGFKKEKDIIAMQGGSTNFNMIKGMTLAIIGGVLSGIFNVSLEFGQPIADLAAQNGAGQFQGNAKMIVSTAGCFMVNLVWFVVAGIRQNTLKEFTLKSGLTIGELSRNTLWSAFAGLLWFGQFFFYGLGHVKMGHFQFASWVLHMSMLIFFSYIIGVIMKEWKSVSRKTYVTLVIALLVLVSSFVITAYGSILGEEIMKTAAR
ncbi:MAG: L-rhamnose/proton symporter RhaT [Bacteroidota bacterium]|nr:L-rhamnose/proton symporter RhaT [Bacteroidota bacterium]